MNFCSARFQWFALSPLEVDGSPFDNSVVFAVMLLVAKLFHGCLP